MSALVKMDSRISHHSPEALLARHVMRPSRAEAEHAVNTLIRWAGDDPDREGLIDTPARVVRAYEQWFVGYDQDPDELLQRTFEETAGYDEMVVLRDIRFVSHCEHHMAPIIGLAHIGYLPGNRVVGISKLARLVEAYAKRLQIQERMTAEIANTLNRVLMPQGVAVVVEGALTVRPRRIATVTAMTDCKLERLEKAEVALALLDEPIFSELFISYLLARKIQAEQDLVDQLLNPTERRLARRLLLMAGLGKVGVPGSILMKISQETLAKMIATTQSRVSFFMNRFRSLGLIDYNGTLRVRSSLSKLVVSD